MKKSFKTALLYLLLVGLLCQEVTAQTIYKTGFDSDSEIRGWIQFRVGKQTSNGWEIDDGGVLGSKKLVNISPTGDADKDSKIDWYVSPKLTFDDGGRIDSLSYMYWTFMGSHFPEESVEVYLLKGSQNPGFSSNILLCDLSDEYSGDETWRDTTNILIPKSSEDCYIAFRFVAVDGWSKISFDNLKVIMNQSASIKVMEKNEVDLFPNPASKILNVRIDSELMNSEYTIYGSDGRKVLKSDILNNLNSSIDLDSLNSGLYFLSLKNANYIKLHKFYVE
ncbi:MAG: T9SS type A sorting domain-containing protein [Bacteroidia bacterium]|nr:T9SS type A sorting domain-containing protein [Bacteroidia bacterium]|tara:strand:- start:3298 stop:4134 length:837 start_codon:yes stop_codon:yes gene_type:complete